MQLHTMPYVFGRILFPVEATVPQEQGIPAPLLRVNPPGKFKILLVADTRDQAHDIKKLLMERCFVEIHTDAERAYSFYRPRFYDLVMVDYNTYGMDSFQFYRNLRKVDQTTKVCLITTNSTAKAPEKTVAVLSRPFSNAKLVETISRLLEE